MKITYLVGGEGEGDAGGDIGTGDGW